MPGQQGDERVSRRAGRRLRRLAAGMGACALVTGLAVGPAQAVAATRLVDYGGGYGAGNGYGWGDGSGNGYGYGNGAGGDQGGQGSTADSAGNPATGRESRGVVLIDTELYDGSQAAGTGIVLTSSGTVLTNYHVIEGSTAIRATIASTGRTFTARVVGVDKKSDIAVLQLRSASGLKTATIDNDALDVGDKVTAVGNAGGTDTLTAAHGRVTALNQKITTQAEAAVAGETLTGLIQTDADVVAGDSGGPLLDSQGQVAGIDTAASSGGTVQGYAIPIGSAEAIVRQIESGHAGTDIRIGAAAYLGVQVTTATADGSGAGDWGSYDDPQGGWYGNSGPYGNQTDTAGAAVIGVEPGTPAAHAGLAAGDVITRVGSRKISTADQLSSALSAYRPGDTVRIGWTDSNGRPHSATVTLAASPIN